MSSVAVAHSNNIATVQFARGKVNAFDEDLTAELLHTFNELETNDDTGAIVLTGQGKFFSFGFDIPHFIDHSPDQFRKFLKAFTDLCYYLFLFPKPIVAALNGHTVAGGCVLALVADYRVMIEGKSKVALNEISLGASIFARSVEMLKFHVGGKAAAEILYTGDMYSVAQAHSLGLVDQVCAPEELDSAACARAAVYASKEPGAFAHTKHLLRSRVVEGMESAEAESIDRFIELWYSDSTQEIIRKVEIRS